MFRSRLSWILCFVMIGSMGHAFYAGNPSFPMMPERGLLISKDFWFGVKAGYAFDQVYGEKIELQPRGFAFRKTVNYFHSVRNLGVITVNFNDRVEFFSPLGAMSCSLANRPLVDTTVSYQMQSSFIWGAGTRAIVAYWGDLQLGVNAIYMQSQLPLSSLKVSGKGYLIDGAHMRFEEWSVGMGLSYRFPWVVPYIGAEYLNFRSKIKHLNSIAFLFPKKHVTFKEMWPAGLVLGLGLSPERGFNANFEVRLINVTAITASIDVKF